MSFFDRFRKKVEKKQLEERAAKAGKELELAKKTKKQENEKTGKRKMKKILIGKPEERKAAKKIYKPKLRTAHKILIKPLITEKISSASPMGKYAFLVSPDANKPMVKKAVSALYGVNVLSVRIINVMGKKVRYGRSYGQRSDWKKAIVTLSPNEKIEIYEGV